MTSARKNPFLGGFLFGLFAGLALALTVALLVTRNNPFVGGSDSDGAASENARQTVPAEAPRYEFNEATTNATPPDAAPQVSTHYYLQAGAFSNAGDADQMKARLALLGFEARVEVSGSQDSAPLSRVQIGPYLALDELNSARARLTQGGIETLLVRLPPPTTKQEKP